MKPTIFLALTHDCELWGDGSGDIEEVLFAPVRKLLQIYGKYRVQTSFTPDVMQQLAFRRLGMQHSQLKAQADSWDEHMLLACQQGHDIQLHIHSQWLNAEYSLGKWSLTSAWSLLNHDPGTVFTMVEETKEYLERLLQRLDPSYRCVAFRAGALAIAPSPNLLDILVRSAIVLDVSIAPGLHVDTRHLQLDYRRCEESLLPFYPRMDDARKISNKPEEIVCIPIHTFYGSRRQVFREHVEWFSRVAKRRILRPIETKRPIATYGRQHWLPRSHSSALRRVYDKGLLPYLSGKFLIADTGRLSRSYALLLEMLASIRRQALTSGEKAVPVVITNHPKEIWSFQSLERFIAEASQADDIRFITLTELARKLRAHEFPIKKTGEPLQPGEAPPGA